MVLQANPQSNLDNNSEKQTILEIDFPKGFNKDNCVCIAFGMKATEERNYSYGVGFSASYRSVTGSLIRDVILDTSKIKLNVWQMATSEKTVYYRLVLMKIPNYEENSDYVLGDVNRDGEITQADADLVNNFYVGNTALTEQQIKAADVNKDGKVTPADATKIQQYINGTITNF